jgi:hypothetical protein
MPQSFYYERQAAMRAAAPNPYAERAMRTLLNPHKKSSRAAASPSHVGLAQYARERRGLGGRAATLVVGLAGVSPAGGNCPVATVVISGNGEGDQTVESPEVKVSCKGGEQLSRS